MNFKIFISVMLVSLLAFTAFGEFMPQKIIIAPDNPTSLEVRISMDKAEGSTYSPGEKITFYFQTNKDAYVAVMDIEPTGKTNLIFPNKYQQQNFVKANTLYKIPERYNFVVGSDRGKETVFILASTEQFTEYNAWNQEFTLKSNPYPELTTNAERDLKPMLMKIIIVPDKPEPEWNTASTFFYVGMQAPTTGTVDFSSVPSGATIWLDGNWIGKTTNYKTTLAQGYHYVKYYLTGYQNYETQFYITPGTINFVSAVLTPLGPQYGNVTINSYPSNAAIFMDGQLKGVAPLKINNLTVGSHALKLTLNGYQDYEMTLNIIAGDNGNQYLTLTPKVVQINGTLTVKAFPADSFLSIDGNSYGAVNGEIMVILPSGNHSLVVSKTGYESKTVNFYLNTGEMKTINVELELLLATLRINSSPSGALIYMNGDPTGKKTPGVFSIFPGSVDIRLEKDGYMEWTTSKTVSSGATNEVNATLQSVMGSLSITCNVNAMLYIDGNYRTRLTPNKEYLYELDPEIHEIVLLKEDYFAYVIRVYIESGKTQMIAAVLNSIQ